MPIPIAIAALVVGKIAAGLALAPLFFKASLAGKAAMSAFGLVLFTGTMIAVDQSLKTRAEVEAKRLGRYRS